MKILHLIAGELSGGAARGAYWLHRALIDLGVDSSVLTNARDTLGDESVVPVAESAAARLKLLAARKIAQAPVRLYRKRKPVIFNTGFAGVDFVSHPAYRAADVVHLHWINGLVGIRSLRRIDRPSVWTLRDMWPFTGGCHYALDCERYTEACGQCPQLASTRERDLTSIVLRRKQHSLPAGMRVIGISRWISDCARKSRMFRDRSVETISNNVDTQAFSAVPKQIARQALGLDPSAKIVMVGAQDAADFYKGFELFVEALGHLEAAGTEVILFGGSAAKVPSSVGVRSRHLGFLSNTEALCRAYSAADVFVAPSRMDAFGKTLVEAMSCETPVVCFDATGPRDIVDHRTTGYRARPFDPTDLARGIDWVLSRSPDAYSELCRQARSRAERVFDSRVIARQYVTLYEDLFRGANGQC